MKELLLAIKQVVQADEALLAYIKKVLIAQSGYHPKGTPYPCIVISPESELFEYRELTGKRGKTTFDVTVYGFTEFPGQELGLIGASGVKQGVIDIKEDVDRVLRGNTFDGLVQEAKVQRATYPIPPQQWFSIGLNEVRLAVRYMIRL